MTASRHSAQRWERALRLALTALTVAILALAGAAPALAEHDRNDGLDPATGGYVSVQFLYVFMWEGGWEPERELVEVTPGESDLLTLLNDDVEFQALGLITNDAPDEVLDQAIENVESEDGEVDVVGQDDGAGVPNATLGYVGTPRGGREAVPMLAYMEVQEVSLEDGSGEAPLLLGLFAPAEAFDAAWESATTEIERDMGFGGPVFAGEPVTDGPAPNRDEPADEDEDEDAPAGENAYVDPDVGWSLEWDESWTPYADPAEDGYLGLDNGASFVTLYAATEYDGDSEACVADQLAWLEELDGVSRVRDLELDGEPVAGGDEEAAFAAFRYRYATDEGTSDLVNHYECRTLPDGEAVVVVTLTTLLESYETEVESLTALLAGLSLDGSAPSGEDADEDGSRDAAAAPVASDAARESDTPAMLLRADDLAELGFEGYGGAYRLYRAQPLPRDVTRIAIDLRVQPGEVTERLDAAGMEALNVVIYGYADFESDGPPDLQRGTELVADITSYVVVYLFEGADEASAEAIYAVLTDTSENDDVEEVEGTQVFGDESTITRVEWDDPDDEGGVFHSIDVTFRSGDLVGEVRLQLPIDGEEPTVEQIEALAERFVERIEGVRAGEAPGLSNLIVRFDGAGVSPQEQRYTVLDGDYDAIAGATESDNERVYEETLFSPSQMYVNRQYYAGTQGDFANGVSFSTAVFVYEDAEGAADYLASIPAFTEQQGLEERDAPALGDEALAYVTPASADAQRNHVYVRIDNVVIRIQISAPTLPPDDAVDALVEEQIACLEAGECEPMRVPRDIRALDETS